MQKARGAPAQRLDVARKVRSQADSGIDRLEDVGGGENRQLLVVEIASHAAAVRMCGKRRQGMNPRLGRRVVERLEAPFREPVAHHELHRHRHLASGRGGMVAMVVSSGLESNQRGK